MQTGSDGTLAQGSHKPSMAAQRATPALESHLLQVPAPAALAPVDAAWLRAVTEALMHGTGLPASQLAACWSQFGPALRDRLHGLEGQLQSPGLARRCTTALERHVLPSPLPGALTLSHTLAVPVDFTALRAIEPGPGIDTLLLEFDDGNGSLCRIEQPLSGTLSATALARLLQRRLGTELLLRRAQMARQPGYRRALRRGLLKSTLRSLPARFSRDAQRRALAGPHLSGLVEWAAFDWFDKLPATGPQSEQRAAEIVAAARAAAAEATTSLAKQASKPHSSSCSPSDTRGRADHLPVLAYGAIGSEPGGLLPVDALDAQLALLRQHGWSAIDAGMLERHRAVRAPLPGRPVLLTFDGGLSNFTVHVWPVLRRHGFCATVLLGPDELPCNAADWQPLRDLHDAGVGFGLKAAATGSSSEALLQDAAHGLALLQAGLGAEAAGIATGDDSGEREWAIVRTAGCRLCFAGDAAVHGRSSIWDDAPLRRLSIAGDWSLARFAAALHLDQRPPLVTVVIPAYNAARTIDLTLDSVRAQTHSHLEILVVDDGSRDATAARVQAHASVDPRVRLLHQANAGVAAARNLGIRQAAGDFIAPVDADDLWRPDKIERQLGMFEHGPPTLGLVYTWYAIVDAAGCTTAHVEPQPAGRVLHALMRLGNFVGNGSAALIRREVLQRVGYDSSLRARGAEGCEDFKLYVEIATQHGFAVVPDHLTGYRVVDGNMSSAVLKMRRSYELVMDEFLARHPDQRAEFDQGRALALQWLFDRALQGGDLAAATQLARGLAALDPLRARYQRLTLWQAQLGRWLAQCGVRPAWAGGASGAAHLHERNRTSHQARDQARQFLAAASVHAPASGSTERTHGTPFTQPS